MDAQKISSIMDNKKISAIIAAVILIVVGLGIYWLLSRAPEAPPTEEGLPAQEGAPQPGVEQPAAGEPSEAPLEAPEAPAGTPAAPQASPISGEGEVVTPAGEPVKLNVEPGSPEAPQQSAPLEKKDIPATAVKITMSPSGISPDAFTVKPGQAITLSVTADESQTHVFKFDDPSLSAVAVGVGPGETRVISFNAPKAGEYVFYCDVPGHRGRGEVGKMIVK